MVDSYISTHLFAGGRAVQGETKQRWIEPYSEAGICDDPKRMNELSQLITALLDQAKRRPHAVAPHSALDVTQRTQFSQCIEGKSLLRLPIASLKRKAAVQHQRFSET
jgi:hypothetical protein